MKKAAYTFTVLLIFIHTFGQASYEPQILILSPGNVKYDKGFEEEIRDLNQQIKKYNKYEERSKALSSAAFQKQPENFKEMTKNDIEFSKDLDFTKQISLLCEQFLLYKFYEKFPNLLITVKDIKSNGTSQALKILSEKNNLQYVLNFPDVSFYKDKGISCAKLAIQFYDHTTNTFLIDTSYIGNWDNPGFEFACQYGTLSCTINNAIAQALDKIIYTVAANSPTLQQERKLARQRFEALRNEYFSKTPDKTFTSAIITSSDSNIVLDNQYQLLINDDKTKFVGFFLNKKDKQNLKSLSDSKEDNNVKILHDKDIRDTGYLDNLPQTYAYIVKGVRYKEKWYYEKAEVTYFQPQDHEEGRLEFFNNLQHWGFFKDNSTVFNPDFWETHLFEKVTDLRKNPDWDKYGNTIWKAEEEENRNYIGLYKIVADQLKEKKTNQPVRIEVR